MSQLQISSITGHELKAIRRARGMTQTQMATRARCCGAKTRDGEPCMNPFLPGKTRCALHGGMSTGPRTRAGRQRISRVQSKRWADRKWVSFIEPKT